MTEFISEELLTKWLIMLASTAFIYVSLGRAALFRYEKPARVIISLAIGVTAISAIGEHWSTVTSVAGYVVAAGLTSLLVWRVALQRGKTIHEIRDQKDLEKWRNENK